MDDRTRGILRIIGAQHREKSGNEGVFATSETRMLSPEELPPTTVADRHLRIDLSEAHASEDFWLPFRDIAGFHCNRVHVGKPTSVFYKRLVDDYPLGYFIYFVYSRRFEIPLRMIQHDPSFKMEQLTPEEVGYSEEGVLQAIEEHEEMRLSRFPAEEE